VWGLGLVFFFFKQKTAYEISVCDWSSDVCSSDLVEPGMVRVQQWRPSTEQEAKSPAALWGGMGRKD